MLSRNLNPTPSKHRIFPDCIAHAHARENTHVCMGACMLQTPTAPPSTRHVHTGLSQGCPPGAGSWREQDAPPDKRGDKMVSPHQAEAGTPARHHPPGWWLGEGAPGAPAPGKRVPHHTLLQVGELYCQDGL